VPFGVIASGRTGPLSNSTKEVWASAELAPNSTPTTRTRARQKRSDMNGTATPPGSRRLERVFRGRGRAVEENWNAGAGVGWAQATTGVGESAQPFTSSPQRDEGARPYLEIDTGVACDLPTERRARARRATRPPASPTGSSRSGRRRRPPRPRR